jgi:hypothetical protein
VPVEVEEHEDPLVFLELECQVLDGVDFGVELLMGGEILPVEVLTSGT